MKFNINLLTSYSKKENNKSSKKKIQNISLVQPKAKIQTIRKLNQFTNNFKCTKILVKVKISQKMNI